MIIKGNRHSNGGKLAAYLMNGGKRGERVEAPELRGFGSYNDDIFKAFSFLHVLADGEIENPLFHVQVRLPEGEQISREQWQQTAERIEKRLGLTGQARADVYHIDEQTGEPAFAPGIFADRRRHTEGQARAVFQIPPEGPGPRA